MYILTGNPIYVPNIKSLFVFPRFVLSLRFGVAAPRKVGQNRPKVRYRIETKIVGIDKILRLAT